MKISPSVLAELVDTNLFAIFSDVKFTQDDFVLPADFYATPEGQPHFYAMQQKDAVIDEQLELPLGQLVR